MKILFVITGFGFGDTMRMKALINQLRTKTSLHILILGYEHSYEYFRTKYLTLNMHGYDFPDKNLTFKPFPFVMKNIPLPLKWAKTWNEHKHTIKHFNPDIIISDFEPIANLIGKKIKKPVISVFAYDPELYKKFPNKNITLAIQATYLNKIYKQSTEVFIPTFLKPHTTKNNYHYVNPLIKRTPEELPQEKVLLKKLGLKKPPILVMLGGSDYGVTLANQIKELLPRFKEEFIFFGSKQPIGAHHYNFKYNFLEYLKVSKALITLAGNLTLTEGIIFKKPMLVFPIKNHIEQELNAYALKDIIMQGDTKNLRKTITTFLKELNTYKEKVTTFSLTADGAEEISDHLLKKYS